MLINLDGTEKSYWLARLAKCWNILEPRLAIDLHGQNLRYYYQNELVAEEFWFSSKDHLLHVYIPEYIENYLC